MTLFSYWISIKIILMNVEMLKSFPKTEIMIELTQNIVGERFFRKYWNGYGNKPYLRQFTLPFVAPTTQDIPVRSRLYNPSFGYEPYWPHGDWVFRTSTIDPNTTVAGQCEVVTACNIIYERYGVICGMNKYYEKKTFQNYCDMINYDCNKIHGWYISHRGKCRPDPATHVFLPTPGPWTTSKMIQTAATLTDSFFKRYTAEHLFWHKPSTTRTFPRETIKQ